MHADENGGALALRSAIDTALARNLDVAGAAAGVTWARHVLDAAWGHWFPSVDVSASYTKGTSYIDLGLDGGGPQSGAVVPHFAVYDPTGQQRLDLVSMDELKAQALEGVGGKTDIAKPWRAEVTIEQPIFAWQIPAGIRKAEAGLAMSQHGREVQRQETALRVTESFYNVLKARDGAAVAERTLQRAREQHRVSRRLYEEGERARTDFLRSEVHLAEAEQTLLSAQNGARLAERAFNMLLRRPLGQRAVLDTAAHRPNRTVPPVDTCVSIALSLRPELRALEARRRLHDGEIESAKAEFYPQVGLSAAYGWEHANPLLSREKEHWRVSVGMKANLFNGFTDRNRLQAARVNRRKGDLETDAIRDRIALHVTQSYLNLGESRQRLVLARRRIESASESYRAVNAAYREGVATKADQLGVSTALTFAEANHVAARYDLLVNRARLDHATGRILQEISEP